MSDLTINQIKSMDDRQRKKVRSEELLTVILTSDNEKSELYNTLNESVKSLNDTIAAFREEVATNSTKIIALNSKIILLEQDNNMLKSEIEDVQRRSRFKNIEIVGLPEPQPNSSDENMAIQLFGELGVKDFRSEDIEAWHVVSTRRKDGERVVVCRFVSRKTKERILAKKGIKDVKLKGSTVYLNEQLSPNNRKIFGLASINKRELNYKFVWMKNGNVFLKKDENSMVIKCVDINIFDSLH